MKRTAAFFVALVFGNIMAMKVVKIELQLEDIGIYSKSRAEAMAAIIQKEIDRRPILESITPQFLMRCFPLANGTMNLIVAAAQLDGLKATFDETSEQAWCLKYNKNTGKLEVIEKQD